jgi:hypothetical protein
MCRNVSYQNVLPVNQPISVEYLKLLGSNKISYSVIICLHLNTRRQALNIKHLEFQRGFLDYEEEICITWII